MTNSQVVKIWFNGAIQVKELKEITLFNTTARYPDIKQKLYFKATKDFTQKWLDAAQKLAYYLNKFLKT